MTGNRPIPLARPRIGDAERSAVLRVLDSRHLAQGPEAAALEREVAALLGGRRDVVATSSGGAALLVSLSAAGVGPGDEVVVPAFTFPAAAQAAFFLGAVPVPAEVDPDTMAVTADSVAARLSARTRAVVVAHAFGVPADVEAVADVARPRGIALVEDAACSLGGTTPGGAPSGSVGDWGCFSLHPRKLVTAGEGGLVACDPARAARVRTLRDYGRTGSGFGDIFGDAGLNLRLSDLAAAVARAQVAALAEGRAARARIAAAYRDALAGCAGVRIPAGFDRPGTVFQSFVVVAADGPTLVARLAAQGIGAGPAAHALTAQAVFRARCPGAPECPVAEALARQAVALPLYEEMDLADAVRVAAAVRTAVAGTAVEAPWKT
jgi:dTDP-4-amino-4,6-dideoxygalactose transaminase